MSWNLLTMINKLWKKTIFVQFEETGKEGAVIYHEGLKFFRFYMEFGGKDVAFILTIPSTNQWKRDTGFSVEKRTEILKYVAEQTHKHKAPNCAYKINESEILFISKPNRLNNITSSEY